MNHTQLLLRYGLSSGALHNLAIELLKVEKGDWQEFTSTGNVEGSDQTRKGQPDIWARTKSDNVKVHIQVAKDSTQGKMLEDLIKSIEVLEKGEECENAICVAFLSYDPASEEEQQCRELCREKGCRFELYTNTKVSELLDQKYRKIRSEYLKIQDNSKPIVLLDLDHKKSGNIVCSDFSCARFRVANVGNSPAANIRISAIRKFNDGYELRTDSRSFGVLMAQESVGEIGLEDLIYTIPNDFLSRGFFRGIESIKNEYILFLLDYKDNTLHEYNSILLLSIERVIGTNFVGKLELVQ